MTRQIFLSIAVVAAIVVAAWQLTFHDKTSDSVHTGDGHLEPAGAAEPPKGPHGGKLFQQDDFAIELVVYETGVPPEFHAYPYRAGEPLDPAAVELHVTLTRLDGEVERFDFSPSQDFLRGRGVVVEPHSFDVNVAATYQGQTYRWNIASYEGRTQIPETLARESGIKTEPAGPQTIVETVSLTGRVVTPPNQVAMVRARFPGVVQRLSVELGDSVDAGQVLARVQSNDSLQSYSLTSPIDGIVLARDVHPGAATGDAPLFVIADLSRVWVELDVFGADAAKVRVAQPVTIQPLNGTPQSGTIDWISPLSASGSQSVKARMVLTNTDGQLRPGQFVRGKVAIAKHPVALAVRQSAIQGFRDFRVVFARIGDTYEVRMLKLGRANDQWVEVLGGLKPGTEYVVTNSFLVKADIEKSGASHDH